MAFAGTKTHGSACGCCTGCSIDSDTFDGALSKWTQDVGTWSTSGGLLTHTGAGTITLNAASSGPSSRTRVETFPSASGSTGVMRIHIAKYDADNLLFGEIDETANTIRIGEVAGGVERYLAAAVTFTPASRPTICFYWRPGVSQTQYAVTNYRGPNRGASTGAPAWADPNAIITDDNTLAQCTFDTVNQTSGLLESDDYQFILPGGAIVTTITVGCRAQSGDATHEIIDKAVTLTIPNNTPGASTIVFETQTVPFVEGGLEWSGAPSAWGYATVPRSSDFNDTEFGANFQFKIGNDPDPPNNAPMGVDFTAITLAFSTPPRTSGRLVLSYNSDCTSATGVYAHESGLKSGMQVVSGTWDWTQYDYSYAQSDSRPTCPTCTCGSVGDGPACTCCGAATPAADEYEITTNISWASGGSCPSCTTLPGTVVVTTNGSCTWAYTNEMGCASLGILQYELKLVSSGPDCIWRLSVAESQLALGGASPNAIYESAAITSTQCRNGPITLSKVSGLDPNGIGSRCLGSWPATMILEGPA